MTYEAKNRLKIGLVLSFIAICLALLLFVCYYFITNERIKANYVYDGAIYEDSNEYLDNYGYNYFKSRNERQEKLYKDIYFTATGFSHSDQDLKLYKKDYAILYITYSKDVGLTFDETLQVFEVFILENPQFYWVTTFYYSDKLKYVYFSIDKDYINYEDRLEYNRSIERKVESLDCLMEGIEDDYDKIVKLHDYIISNMKYSYITINGKKEANNAHWAHNIIGFVEYGEGVCETYGKTFTYFCKRYGIKNISVWGDKTENENVSRHTWNMVEIDGLWYAIDLTGDDSRTSSGTRKYFCISEEYYLSIMGYDYSTTMYELPSNSAKTSLSDGIIELYENDTLIFSSRRIESIYSKFNNKDYKIKLIGNDELDTYFYLDYIDTNYSTLTIEAIPTNVDSYVTIVLKKDLIITKDITLLDIDFKSSGEKLIINGAILYFNVIGGDLDFVFENGGKVKPINS